MISGILTDAVDFDLRDGVFEVEVSTFEPDFGDIFIARYTNDGDLIYAHAEQVILNSNYTLNLNGLSKGMYQLQVLNTNQQKTYVRSFIIDK